MASDRVQRNKNVLLYSIVTLEDLWTFFINKNIIKCSILSIKYYQVQYSILI